jgi:AraC-like DNA-binding protein
MYYEFGVRIAKTEKTVFMRGFDSIFETTDSPVHSHPFSEIHVILDGEVDFRFGGELKTVGAGGIIAIPQGVRHSVTKHLNRSFVFGLRENIGRVYENILPEQIIREFEGQIAKSRKDGNFSVISSYISFFCASFFPEEKVIARECTDQAFIIEDYFDTHYSDAKLSELSEILGLSEKQTARIVLKHTGNSFKEELRSRRVMAAQKLYEEGGMTLSKIAETVGYTSYSSLWKAMKKQNCENY